MKQHFLQTPPGKRFLGKFADLLFHLFHLFHLETNRECMYTFVYILGVINSEIRPPRIK